VSFSTSMGQRKIGVVIRLNKKTASICTEDGDHWNVHPSFLTAVGTHTIDVRVEGSGQ
jgi:hypothetical protein